MTKQHFTNNNFDMPIVKIPNASGKGDAPYKNCPGEYSEGILCQEQLHPKVCICPHCGFEFEDTIAESLPSMKEVNFNETFQPDPPEWLDVVDLSIDLHTSKKNGKELLKVTLSLDTMDRLSSVTEWICFPDQYEGYAVTRGMETWEKYTTAPVPEDTTEGLWVAQGDFESPVRALVNKNERGYWVLQELDFDGDMDDFEMPQDPEVELTQEELDMEVTF